MQESASRVYWHIVSSLATIVYVDGCSWSHTSERLDVFGIIVNIFAMKLFRTVAVQTRHLWYIVYLVFCESYDPP